MVNEHPVTSRGALKRKITEITKKMDEEEVARACTCFRTRREKVIDPEGSRIESMVEQKCHYDVEVLNFCLQRYLSIHDSFY